MIKNLYFTGKSTKLVTYTKKEGDVSPITSNFNLFKQIICQ